MLTPEEIRAALMFLDRANLRGRVEATAFLTIDSKLRQALNPPKETPAPQIPPSPDMNS